MTHTYIYKYTMALNYLCYSLNTNCAFVKLESKYFTEIKNTHTDTLFNDNPPNLLTVKIPT